MVNARMINACEGQVAIKYFTVQHYSPIVTISPGMETFTHFR